MASTKESEIHSNKEAEILAVQELKSAGFGTEQASRLVKLYKRANPDVSTNYNQLEPVFVEIVAAPRVSTENRVYFTVELIKRCFARQEIDSDKLEALQIMYLRKLSQKKSWKTASASDLFQNAKLSLPPVASNFFCASCPLKYRGEKFRCSICRTKFPLKCQLNKHQFIEHEILNENADSKCDFCEKSYPGRPVKLGRHVSSHLCQAKHHECSFGCEQLIVEKPVHAGEKERTSIGLHIKENHACRICKDVVHGDVDEHVKSYHGSTAVIPSKSELKVPAQPERSNSQEITKSDKLPKTKKIHNKPMSLANSSKALSIPDYPSPVLKTKPLTVTTESSIASTELLADDSVSETNRSSDKKTGRDPRVHRPPSGDKSSEAPLDTVVWSEKVPEIKKTKTNAKEDSKHVRDDTHSTTRHKSTVPDSIQNVHPSQESKESGQQSDHTSSQHSQDAPEREIQLPKESTEVRGNVDPVIFECDQPGTDWSLCSLCGLQTPPSGFCCKLCQDTYFSYAAQLQVHMRDIHNSKIADALNCEFCKESVPCDSLLEHILMDAHQCESEHLYCDCGCKILFSSEQDLIVHHKINSVGHECEDCHFACVPSQRSACPLCPTPEIFYENEEELTHHQVLCHSMAMTGSISCQMCPASRQTPIAGLKKFLLHRKNAHNICLVHIRCPNPTCFRITSAHKLQYHKDMHSEQPCEEVHSPVVVDLISDEEDRMSVESLPRPPIVPDEVVDEFVPINDATRVIATQQPDVSIACLAETVADDSLFEIPHQESQPSRTSTTPGVSDLNITSAFFCQMCNRHFEDKFSDDKNSIDDDIVCLVCEKVFLTANDCFLHVLLHHENVFHSSDFYKSATVTCSIGNCAKHETQFKIPEYSHHIKDTHSIACALHFRCSNILCKQLFSNEDSLDCHSKVCRLVGSSISLGKCPDCDFTSTLDLLSGCSSCEMTLAGDWERREHENINHKILHYTDDRNIVCRVPGCIKMIPASEFAKHRYSEHSICLMHFVCQRCCGIFPSQSAHFGTCSSPKPVINSVEPSWKKILKTRWTHRKTPRDSTQQSSFFCQTCNLTFVSDVEKEFDKCALCVNYPVFVSHTEFLYHLRKVHQSIIIPVNNLKETTQKCNFSLCRNKTSMNTDQFICHRTKKHGICFEHRVCTDATCNILHTPGSKTSTSGSHRGNNKNTDQLSLPSVLYEKDKHCSVVACNENLYQCKTCTKKVLSTSHLRCSLCFLKSAKLFLQTADLLSHIKEAHSVANALTLKCYRCRNSPEFDIGHMIDHMNKVHHECRSHVICSHSDSCFAIFNNMQALQAHLREVNGTPLDTKMPDSGKIRPVSSSAKHKKDSKSKGRKRSTSSGLTFESRLSDDHTLSAEHSSVADLDKSDDDVFDNHGKSSTNSKRRKVVSPRAKVSVHAGLIGKQGKKGYNDKPKHDQSSANISHGHKHGKKHTVTVEELPPGQPESKHRKKKKNKNQDSDLKPDTKSSSTILTSVSLKPRDFVASVSSNSATSSRKNSSEVSPEVEVAQSSVPGKTWDELMRDLLAQGSF